MNNKIYIISGKLRSKYQKNINDTFIWFSISQNAIKTALEDKNFLTKESSKVPSNKKTTIKKGIKRTKEELSNILEKAYSRDLNSIVIISIIAQVEAYFSDLLESILRIDRRRLLIKINGINHTKSFEINKLFDFARMDDIFDDLIKKELISVFYASPEKQFEYIQKVCSINFDSKLDNLMKKYVEFKATRDILVHNSGLINDVYLQKVGNNSRGKIGEILKVDNYYLEDVVKTSKSIIGSLSSLIQKENKD